MPAMAATVASHSVGWNKCPPNAHPRGTSGAVGPPNDCSADANTVATSAHPAGMKSVSAPSSPKRDEHWTRSLQPPPLPVLLLATAPSATVAAADSVPCSVAHVRRMFERTLACALQECGPLPLTCSKKGAGPPEHVNSGWKMVVVGVVVGVVAVVCVVDGVEVGDVVVGVVVVVGVEVGVVVGVVQTHCRLNFPLPLTLHPASSHRSDGTQRPCSASNVCAFLHVVQRPAPRGAGPLASKVIWPHWKAQLWQLSAHLQRAPVLVVLPTHTVLSSVTVGVVVVVGVVVAEVVVVGVVVGVVQMHCRLNLPLPWIAHPAASHSDGAMHTPGPTSGAPSSRGAPERDQPADAEGGAMSTKNSV